MSEITREQLIEHFRKDFEKKLNIYGFTMLTKWKILSDFLYKLSDYIKESRIKLFILKGKEDTLNVWYYDSNNEVQKFYLPIGKEWKKGLKTYFKTYKDKKIFNFDYCDNTNLEYFFEKELLCFMDINEYCFNGL